MSNTNILLPSFWDFFWFQRKPSSQIFLHSGVSGICTKNAQCNSISRSQIFARGSISLSFLIASAIISIDLRPRQTGTWYWTEQLMYWSVWGPELEVIVQAFLALGIPI